jgi:Na+-transporting NADH:ubiquinone oxidoreductase subunit NqrF
MMQMQIFGNASQKIYKTIEIADLKLLKKQSLMDFLLSHQIPVASSCLGEGICRKCVVNKEILSCQIELSQFISQSHIQSNPNQNLIIISIDYL